MRNPAVIIVLLVLAALVHGRLSMVGGSGADLRCELPRGLSFCSDITYNVSRLYVRDFTSQDQQARQEFDKYAPYQPIQTAECRNGFKQRICALKFPKCPYCVETNALCRDSGCVEYVARCANQPGDTLLTCFTADLYVDGTGTNRSCTPGYYPSGFKCAIPVLDSRTFCSDVVRWSVPSAPSSIDAALPVWYKMANITYARYVAYSSAAGVTEPCKSLLQNFLCRLAFSPCNDANPREPVLNPLAVLQPWCNDMATTCPANIYSKLCVFPTPTPPDPNQCRPAHHGMREILLHP